MDEFLIDLMRDKRREVVSGVLVGMPLEPAQRLAAEFGGWKLEEGSGERRRDRIQVCVEDGVITKVEEVA